MTMQNFYEEFASIYDKLMDDVDYEKWTDFIVQNGLQYGNRVLEAACGTGNVTVKLAEKNIKISAFDSSDEMLAIAYEKLRKNKNVSVLNQDMTNFSLSGEFDVCICCCDGVNYLDLQNAGKFFENVFRQLTCNGIFIFDISTKYKYLNMDETFVYEDEKLFYVWENNLEENEQIISMEINFFVQDGEKYDRITEIQTHHMHDVEILKELLEKTGFKYTTVFDDYSSNPACDKSIRATFVCKKSE